MRTFNGIWNKANYKESVNKLDKITNWTSLILMMRFHLIAKMKLVMLPKTERAMA